ncbi:MAG: lysylphosphatidylglycerol synthase domain-containing protein, partial [Gammaproteobacteria bacterium]|nr:lysylphosphatidylglycerol synthase domain-containing protein [Gammaproteobacteria bacterium]
MDPLLGEELAPDQPERQALSEKDIKGFGSYKLICGGLTFIVLTVGIFWYQFYQIPAGTRAPVWGQLQWDYLFWLLLFLPIEPFASGLRMWVIARVLKPGVSLWTCLKAECANIGVAILTPSQTGGGFGQIYMLSRGGLSLGTALTVTLISFLGSIVVLLFIGIHSLLIAKVDRLGIFFHGAFFIFFFIFALLLLVLFWPGSLRFLISG